MTSHRNKDYNRPAAAGSYDYIRTSISKLFLWTRDPGISRNLLGFLEAPDLDC